MVSAPRLQPACDLLVGWLDAGRRWLAVDGLGASGKTTLAAMVQCERPGLHVVHLDDFTRPGTVGWERERFRDQVWQPLRRGVSARYQRWHWTSPEPTDWVEVPADAAILVEGIAASESPDAVSWDGLVWLAAPLGVRMARAAQRDPGRFSCWSTTWQPTEQAWFAGEQPWRRADAVIVTG